jgi:TPP-dependent pyruvate/acetoin dehydrogenase alpha subunit
MSQRTDRRESTSASAPNVASVIDKPHKDAARVISEDRDTLVNIFHQMLLIRRFEEKCAESYSLGKIGGFCHLYIGQEAVGVGAISALRPDDYVITSYREHGQAIAKGITPDAVMAELYGKAGGCSKGKGGSMHLFDAVNFLGGHAIVGGQIPLATGIAFASKYQETDKVTVCFFGEAAVNQGAFHESLNMAQLWKLPCIYLCENNMYGMGTSAVSEPCRSRKLPPRPALTKSHLKLLTAWTCWRCAMQRHAPSSARERIAADTA